MLTELTLIPAYSAEEAGRILENYKIYENKPPEFIQEKQDPSIVQQVRLDDRLYSILDRFIFSLYKIELYLFIVYIKVMDALTSIRSVNKTDATTLITVFGSLAEIINATPEKLALCPGFGPQKAQRVYAALHAKFKDEKIKI